MGSWLDEADTTLPDGYRGRFGLLLMEGIRVEESPAELHDQIAAWAADRVARQEEMPADWKQAVRGLLKQTGFKATGRNKPSSEYQAQTLLKKEGFTFIYNLVDMNNRISLASHLPISVLDRDNFQGALQLRAGLDGEAYVFNPSGQAIDLHRLLCVADTGQPELHANGDRVARPLGNPIKDSMAGKISEATRNAVGVIYMPNPSPAAEEGGGDEGYMQGWLDMWAELATTYAGATATHTRQLVL